MTDALAGVPGAPGHHGPVAELLRRAGTVLESTVQGSSMEPTLPAGARIRIQCGPPPAAVGGVVAFFAGPRLVAHRIVRRDRRGHHVIPRGDARRLCDPPIPVSALVGEVVAWWDGRAWHAPGPPPVPTRPARLAMRLAEGAVAAGLAAHRWVGHGVHGILWVAASVAARLGPRNRHAPRS